MSKYPSYFPMQEVRNCISSHYSLIVGLKIEIVLLSPRSYALNQVRTFLLQNWIYWLMQLKKFYWLMQLKSPRIYLKERLRPKDFLHLLVCIALFFKYIFSQRQANAFRAFRITFFQLSICSGGNKELSPNVHISSFRSCVPTPMISSPNTNTWSWGGVSQRNLKKEGGKIIWADKKDDSHSLLYALYSEATLKNTNINVLVQLP